MQTKSLRLPEDLLASVRIVEEREHLEQAPAIRKLIRMGLQTYVAELYGQGRISLREVAARLGVTQSEAIDLLLERGVRGNLRADDVLASVEAFV